MNGLTQEEKGVALQYAFNGADFMFIPSSELCTMLITDIPQTHGINNVLTTLLLERKPTRLDPNMIIKYCQGTLDKNNTWLFDNGSIKVVPHRLKKEVKLKSEEDKRIDKEIVEKGKASIITKKEENSNE